MVKNKKGWHLESKRHALAAKGVETKKKESKAVAYWPKETYKSTAYGQTVETPDGEAEIVNVKMSASSPHNLEYRLKYKDGQIQNVREKGDGIESRAEAESRKPPTEPTKKYPDTLIKGHPERYKIGNKTYKTWGEYTRALEASFQKAQPKSSPAPKKQKIELEKGMKFVSETSDEYHYKTKSGNIRTYNKKYYVR